MTAYEGLVYDLDEEIYHGLPGLSSTGAKQILRSPAHYQQYLANQHEQKDEFDVGSLVHAKVLGVGAKHTIYPDGNGPETFETIDDKGKPITLTNVLAADGGLRTKASKAFADEARAHGLIPMKRVAARVVDKMAESILGHDEARALIENGWAEVSMFATDPEYGVDRRGRLDYLRKGTIADVKTTAGEASESAFAVSFFRLGYDVQFGHYEGVFEQITGTRLPFLWIVVESSAPYLTNVFTLDEKAEQIGRERAARALRRYAEARDGNRWGGYVNAGGRRIGTITPPQFAIYDSIDASNADAAEGIAA
jgi:hypothetical protein